MYNMDETDFPTPDVEIESVSPDGRKKGESTRARTLRSSIPAWNRYKGWRIDG